MLTPNSNNPLKKKDRKPSNAGEEATQPHASLATLDAEINTLLAQRTQKYTWMIPVMVVMVVGATIYLAVLERKTEYVYSLATACFGYYFGNLNAGNFERKPKPDEPLHGVDELTE